MPSLASAGLASMAMMAGFVQLGHAATVPIAALRVRQDTTDWKSVQCTSDGVNDASVDEATRWSKIAADGAWSEVVSAWQTRRDNDPDNQFPFSRHVSNVFNGPEFMDCHKLTGSNGCHSGNALQCHDTNHPAGYFILNSFWKLNGILWNLHETLDNAHSDIGGGIGTFSDTFAPQKEKTMDLNLIMDVVLLGYGSLAAPIWKSALQGWKFAANRPNDFDSLTDFTNNLVSNGITLAKDVAAADGSLGSQNQVTERLRDIIRIWQDSVVKLAEKLFGGSDDAMETLGKVIANGKMVASTTDVPSVEELRHQLERSIYAALIPLAWEISEQDISPFVLDSGMSCEDAGGDWGQDEGKFLDGVKDSGMACHDGRAYYLVGATGSCHGGSPFEDNDTKDCSAFPSLPGIKTMDGKAWGGISREDIVFGSINTFAANGNKNHETRLNFADGVPEDQITGLADNIQAANTFALPICDLKTAWENFYKNPGADRSKHNFPCKIDHSGDFNKKEIPPPYDCKGSGMCGSAVNFVRNCDRAVNDELIRNDDVNYGSAESDKEMDGARRDNCKIFIAGPAACTRTGNEMWYDYQDLKNSEMGGCGRCGSKHWGNNNECRTTVNYVS